MKRFEINLWLSGSRTFWLRDEASDRCQPLDYQGSAYLSFGKVFIQATRYVDISMTIEVQDSLIPENLEGWNKILDGTIEFPSGQISIGGLGDPDNEKRMRIESGRYQIYIYSAYKESLTPQQWDEQIEPYKIVLLALN